MTSPVDQDASASRIPFRRSVTIGGGSKSLETDASRSALMGRVRQRGTKPELIVGDWLRVLGRSYRKTARKLPGSPDFANRKRQWAIFVNGCYWHHHRNCRKATIPTRNREFWVDKFKTNRRRDARALRELRRSGFRVLSIWECETRQPERLRARLEVFFGRIDHAAGTDAAAMD